MLSLEQLSNPSDEELARFDVAEVDLSLAVGLPGSEKLDIPACLAWIDRAAAWVRQNTQKTHRQFRNNRAEYDNSEGIFRMVSMVSVLQRGLKVRYNPALIGSGDQPKDSREDFIHGIIDGPGGTCASIPVIYTAVGRRLGYPLKLVTTVRHVFVRWDDPAGERFNIEINNQGMDSFPDDHYRKWPVAVEDTPLRGTPPRFLCSLTPREEVGLAWQKRGYCLQANGLTGAAIKSFAIALSLVPDDCVAQYVLAGFLGDWKRDLIPRIPPEMPGPKVDLSRR